MLSSVLSVSPRISLVRTIKEDEMAFRGNYKFEIIAGSTALIFKRILPYSASKVLPNVWTLVCGLYSYLNCIIFDSKKITFFLHYL